MSDEATNNPESNRGSLRRLILFGVLALLLIALAYDYLVARPGVETAYNQITERSTEVNRDGTKALTNLDVRKLVGRDPSRTFQDDNGDTVEVFSWRSGLPIRKHDLFTVYKSSSGDLLFYRHAKFKYESSSEVSNFSSTTVVQAPPEGYPEEPGGGAFGGDDGAEGDGGSGGFGGGPGGGQRGGAGERPPRPDRPELEDESGDEAQNESASEESVSEE